jgi:hypothetical protein
VPFLRQAWEEVLVSDTLRRTLVRAAAAHRSAAAIEWLAEIAGQSRASVVLDLIEVLAAYRHHGKLAERLQVALAQRGDSALVRRFEELFTNERRGNR